MSFNIALICPEIPPNTGNIARTCALTGAGLHLVKPMGFSIDTKSVKRAGLDYWDLLDLTVHENDREFIEYISNTEANFYFASTKGGSVYTDVSYKDGDFIIFGSETSGLPKWIYEKFKDRLIRVPMLDIPEARSLNLSNTAAILLYEALRQIDFKNLR